MALSTPLLLTGAALGGLLLFGRSSAPDDKTPILGGETPSGGDGVMLPDQIVALVVTNEAGASVYDRPNPDDELTQKISQLPPGTVVRMLAVSGPWVRVLKQARTLDFGKVKEPAFEGWVPMNHVALTPTAARVR